MKKYKDFLLKNYMHVICVVLTIFFVLLAFITFADSYKRVFESLVDLWNSSVYYIKVLFEFDASDVDLSVLKSDTVKFAPLFKVPDNYDSFKEAWFTYWQLFVDKDNFSNYVSADITILYNFSHFVLLAILPVIV